jgi:hypothetical protein
MHRVRKVPWIKGEGIGPWAFRPMFVLTGALALFGATLYKEFNVARYWVRFSGQRSGEEGGRVQAHSVFALGALLHDSDTINVLSHCEIPVLVLRPS